MVPNSLIRSPFLLDNIFFIMICFIYKTMVLLVKP
jgi:hypothetical protein